MNKIVLYASHTGKTEKIAKELALTFKADVVKVLPEREYGSYFSALIRVLKEKILNEQASAGTSYRNLSKYDAILIGFPVWEGDIPTYLQDFLQNCDLGGALVIPFATSGISGIKRAVKTLKKLCPGIKIAEPFVYNIRTVKYYPGWVMRLRSRLN